MNYTEKDIARFWSKIIKKSNQECWEWQASKTHNGYGQFSIGRISVRAHRFIYSITFGEIPEGNVIMHCCDNPCCCNYSHLKLGTIQDNVADRVAKNRSGRLSGEKQNGAKLTTEQVLEIRQKHIPGKYGYVKLAKEYGVHDETIRSIILRKRWSHI